MILGSQGSAIYITEHSPFKIVLDHYLSVVSPLKKGHLQEKYRAKPLKTALGELLFGEITPLHVATYRDNRLAVPHPRTKNKTLSASTIKLEMMMLSHIFAVASMEWGIEIDNPVIKVRKPKPAPGRSRRLTDREALSILKRAHVHQNRELYPVIILALETAMRQGEILSLRWENISWKKRVAHLPYTKNGTMRDVPLSAAAINVLKHWLIPKVEGKLFYYTPSGIKSTWRCLVKSLSIEDLHFHDLRHEAISRLFEKGLDMLEVSTISGHKSLSMLKRYTHLQAYKLVHKLDPKRRGAKQNTPSSIRDFIVSYPAVVERRAKKYTVDFYDFVDLRVSGRNCEDVLGQAKNILLNRIVTLLHNGETPPKPTNDVASIDLDKKSSVSLIHPL